MPDQGRIRTRSTGSGTEEPDQDLIRAGSEPDWFQPQLLSGWWIRNSSQAHRPPAAPGATQTDELFCSVLFSSAAALWNGNIMAHSIYQLVRPHQGSWLQRALLLRLSKPSKVPFIAYMEHNTPVDHFIHTYILSLLRTHASTQKNTNARTHYAHHTPDSPIFFLPLFPACFSLHPSLL